MTLFLNLMVSVFFQRFLLVGAIVSPLGTALAFPPDIDQAALAQVTSDGTLSTTVTSSDSLNFLIEGGDRAGTNLFHSFDEFSIPTNGSARFNHSTDVEIILNRVTGNQGSRINGLLQSGGTADMFLLNPNGIVFGPKAELDIGGSFISTTAEQLVFEDGLEFDTVSTSPLLSITTPVGLQFGSQSGSIVGRGGEPSRLSRTDEFLIQPINRDQSLSHIQVPSGHTLAFLGNGVTFSGSNLVADNGHLALGSIQSGRVTLEQNGDIWQFSHDGVDAWNDIRLRSQSALDVSGMDSHGIQLVGREIRLTEGSLAFIQSLGDAEQADIEVRASDRLWVSGMNPTGTVPSGIRSELVNFSAVPGTVSGGDIHIDALDIVIQDGAEIVLPNYSAQTAGTLDVNVEGLIWVNGVSQLDPIRFSRLGMATFAAGNGGDVNLRGTQLLLTNGGTISSVTGGMGKGGNVHIDMTESIDIKGIGPPTAIEELRAFSTIDASTAGSGNGGSVTLRTHSLALDNGYITSLALASGNAGSIDVEAESIEITASQSDFEVGITSAARANNVIQIGLGLPRIPTGDAGNLSLQTSRLHLIQNAFVEVQSQGPGDGGNIDIEAEFMILQSGSGITAETLEGNGGDLNVNIDKLLVVQDNSFVSATAGDRADDMGNGGNITISGPFIVGVNDSDITANAFQGDGGNINVATLGLYGFELQPRLTDGNDITASSQFGLQGTVQIQNPDVDPSSQVLELPNAFVDISQLVRSGCALDGDQFEMRGRGGLPSSPMEQINGDRPWFDLRNPFMQRNDTVADWSSADPTPAQELIQEATGMAIAPDGTFQLVTSNARNAMLPHASCTSQVKML